MITKFWSENLEDRNNSKRSRRRWEDNIRMELCEIGWVSVECIQLVQNKDQCGVFVNTVINLQVP
jgi:hypothetical protein